jgi:purine-binding chemotaxis protein CheW
MTGNVQNKLIFEEQIKQDCSLLIFKLAGQAFALHIDSVSQIIPMLMLTPIPQTGDMIEGVFNLHGKLVPVVSLRHHLGLPETEPELYTPIILTTLPEQQVGWIVDEVIDVINLQGEFISAPDTILPDGLEYSQIISGLFYQRERPVIILDPGCILQSSQFRTILRVLEEIQSVDPVDRENVRTAVKPESLKSADMTRPEQASETTAISRNLSKRGKHSGV